MSVNPAHLCGGDEGDMVCRIDWATRDRRTMRLLCGVLAMAWAVWHDGLMLAQGTVVVARRTAEVKYIALEHRRYNANGTNINSSIP